MFNQLQALTKKPALYEKGTTSQAAIWTDAHISKGMLDAHLDPHLDAATRPHAYVQEAVKWISATAPVGKYPTLLDLGCGPGIYAELFHKAGYKVTGIDFSARSIAYAQKSAKENGLPITYHCQDYLTLDYAAQFDVVTLIYYDFGVLCPESRARLLAKVHTALRPGGLLIFDVYTPVRLANREESTSWEFSNGGGFFHPQPHLCLSSFFLYEESRIFCDRHIIITEQGVESINIWEHTFTKDELAQNLNAAGFGIKSLHGNIAGAEYHNNGKEICVVAQKEEASHAK